MTGRYHDDGRIEVEEPVEVVQVLDHVAVGRPDHDGRPLHHVVAGEEHRLLLEQPAQVIGGMAGSVQRPQMKVRAVQHEAVADQAVGSDALGVAERDEFGTRPLG